MEQEKIKSREELVKKILELINEYENNKPDVLEEHFESYGIGNKQNNTVFDSKFNISLSSDGHIKKVYSKNLEILIKALVNFPKEVDLWGD